MDEQEQRQHGAERAQIVHGPVFRSGFGWEVRLYFATEEAAQGFAVFATSGWTAHQPHRTPVVRWEAHDGFSPTVGPLPPIPSVMVHSVDTRGDDGVVTIGYTELLWPE